mgnify:CR=1 FL=1
MRDGVSNLKFHLFSGFGMMKCLACKRRDEVVLPEIVCRRLYRNSYDRYFFAIFSIAYKGVSEICHLHTNLMMSACVKMDFY